MSGSRHEKRTAPELSGGTTRHQRTSSVAAGSALSGLSEDVRFDRPIAELDGFSSAAEIDGGVHGSGTRGHAADGRGSEGRHSRLRDGWHLDCDVHVGCWGRSSGGNGRRNSHNRRRRRNCRRSSLGSRGDRRRRRSSARRAGRTGRRRGGNLRSLSALARSRVSAFSAGRSPRLCRRLPLGWWGHILIGLRTARCRGNVHVRNGRRRCRARRGSAGPEDLPKLFL